MPNPNNDNIIRDDNPIKNRNNAANDSNELLRDRDEEIENFEEDYWNDKEEEQDEELGEEVDPLDEVVLELDGSELSAEEIALEDKKDDKKDKKKKKYEDWDYETYADKDTHKLDYDVYADGEVFVNKPQEGGQPIQQPAPQQTTESENLTGFTVNEFGVVQSVNYEENVAKAHDNDQSTTAEFHKIQDLEGRNEVKEQVHANDNTTETVPHTSPIEEKSDIPSHTGDASTEQPKITNLEDVAPSPNATKMEEPYISPILDEQPSAHKDTNTVQHTPNVDTIPVENISIPVDVNKGQEEKKEYGEEKPINVENSIGSSQTIEQPHITETVKTPVVENEPVKQEVQTGEHKTEVYDEPTFIPHIEEKVDNTVHHNEKVEEATPFEFNVGSYKSHVQEGGEQPAHIKTDDNQPQNVEHFDVPGSNEPVVNIPVVEENIPHTETPIHTEEILTEHMPTQHNEINNDVQVPKTEIPSNDFVEEIHTPRENVITQPDVSVKTEEKVDVNIEQPRVKNIVDNIPANEKEHTTINEDNNTRVDNTANDNRTVIDNEVDNGSRQAVESNTNDGRQTIDSNANDSRLAIDNEVNGNTTRHPVSEPSVVSPSDNLNGENITEQPSTVVPPTIPKQEEVDVSRVNNIEEPSVSNTKEFTIGSYQSHVQEGAEQPTHIKADDGKPQPTGSEPINEDTILNNEGKETFTQKEDVVNTPETPVKTPHVENDSVGDTNTNTNINNEQQAFTGRQNDNERISVDDTNGKEAVKGDEILHKEEVHSNNETSPIEQNSAQPAPATTNKENVINNEPSAPKTEGDAKNTPNEVRTDTSILTGSAQTIENGEVLPHNEVHVPNDDKVKTPLVNDGPEKQPKVELSNDAYHEVKTNDTQNVNGDTEQPIAVPTIEPKPSTREASQTDNVKEPSTSNTKEFTVGSYQSHVQEGVAQPTHISTQREDVVNTPETPAKTPHVENDNIGDTNTSVNNNNGQKMFTGIQNGVETQPINNNIGTPNATENTHDNVSQTATPNASEQVKPVEDTIIKETAKGDNTLHKEEVHPKGETTSADLNNGAQPAPVKPSKENVGPGEPTTITTGVENKPPVSNGSVQTNGQQQTIPNGEVNVPGNDKGKTPITNDGIETAILNKQTTVSNDKVKTGETEQPTTLNQDGSKGAETTSNIEHKTPNTEVAQEIHVEVGQQVPIQNVKHDDKVDNTVKQEDTPVVEKQHDVKAPKQEKDQGVPEATIPKADQQPEPVIDNVPNRTPITETVVNTAGVAAGAAIGATTENIVEAGVVGNVPKGDAVGNDNSNRMVNNTTIPEQTVTPNASAQVKPVEDTTNKETVKGDNVLHKEDMPPKVETVSIEQNNNVQPAPAITNKDKVVNNEPSTSKTEVDAKNIPNEIRTETSISTGSAQAIENNEVHVSNGDKVKTSPINDGTEKQPIVQNNAVNTGNVEQPTTLNQDGSKGVETTPNIEQIVNAPKAKTVNPEEAKISNDKTPVDKAAEVIANNEISNNQVPKQEQGRGISEDTISKVKQQPITENVTDVAGGVAAGAAVGVAAEMVVEAGVIANVPKGDAVGNDNSNKIVNDTLIPEQAAKPKQPEDNVHIDNTNAAKQVKIGQETNSEVHTNEQTPNPQPTNNGTSTHTKPVEDTTNKETVKGDNTLHKEEVHPKGETTSADLNNGAQPAPVKPSKENVGPGEPTTITTGVENKPPVSNGSVQTNGQQQTIPNGEVNVPGNDKGKTPITNDGVETAILNKQTTASDDKVKTGETEQLKTPNDNEVVKTETAQNVEKLTNKNEVGNLNKEIKGNKDEQTPTQRIEINDNVQTPKPEISPDDKQPKSNSSTKNETGASGESAKQFTPVEPGDNKQQGSAKTNETSTSGAEHKPDEVGNTGNKMPNSENEANISKQNGVGTTITSNNSEEHGNDNPSIKKDASKQTKPIEDTTNKETVKGDELPPKEKIHPNGEASPVDLNNGAQPTPVKTSKDKVGPGEPTTITTGVENKPPVSNGSVQTNGQQQTISNGEVPGPNKAKGSKTVASDNQTIGQDNTVKPGEPEQTITHKKGASDNKEEAAITIAGVAGVAAAQKAKEEFVMPNLDNVSDDVVKKFTPKVEKPTGEKIETPAKVETGEKEVRSSDPSVVKETKDGEQTANAIKSEKISLEEKTADAVLTAKKFSANEEFSSGMPEKKPVDTKPNTVEDTKAPSDKPKIDEKKLTEQAAKKGNETSTTGDIVAPQFEKSDNGPKEAVIQAVKPNKEQADPKSANIPPQGEVIRTNGGIKPEALANNGGGEPICHKCGRPISKCVCGEGGGNSSDSRNPDGRQDGGSEPICPKCGKPISKCTCGKDIDNSDKNDTNRNPAKTAAAADSLCPKCGKPVSKCTCGKDGGNGSGNDKDGSGKNDANRNPAKAAAAADGLCPKCGKPISKCTCGKGNDNGSDSRNPNGRSGGGSEPICPKCGKPISKCTCGKDNGNDERNPRGGSGENQGGDPRGGGPGKGGETNKPGGKDPRVETNSSNARKDGKGRIKKDETTAKKIEAVGSRATQRIAHSLKAKVMEASDHHEERTARMSTSLRHTVVNAVASVGAMSAVRALKYKDKIFNESSLLSNKLLSEGKITMADLTFNDKGKSLKEKLTKAGYSDSDISRIIKSRKDVAGTFEMREKLLKNLRDDVNAKLKIVTEKNANIDQIKEALTKRVSQMKGFENINVSKLSDQNLMKLLNARGEEGRALATNLISARRLASTKAADFRTVSLQYLALSNNETMRSLAEVVGKGRPRISTLSDGQLKDLIEQAKKGLKTGNFSHSDLTALKMEFDKRMLRKAKNKAPHMRGLARSAGRTAMRIIDEASNSSEIRTLSQFGATVASTVHALNSVKRFAQNRISRVGKRTHEFLMKHSKKYNQSYEKRQAKQVAKNEKKMQKQAKKVEKDLKLKRDIANKAKNTKVGKAVDRSAKKAKDLAKNAKDRFMSTKVGKAAGKAGKVAGKAGKTAGKVAGKASKVVAAPFKFLNAAKALALKVGLIIALVIVIVMMFSYLSLALMEFATPVMDTLDKIGEVAADFWSWITGDVDPYEETRRIYNKLLEKDDKAEEAVKDLIYGDPKFPVTFYGRPITHYTNKKVTYIDAYGNPIDYSTRHPAKTAIALAYVYAGDGLYEMTRSDREQLIYDIYKELTTVIDYGQTYVYSCYCESNSCRGNYYYYDCCGGGYEEAGRYFESLQADIHSDKVDSRFQGVNGSSFIIGINDYYAIDPTEGDETGYTAYCNGHPVYATDPETGESVQVTTYYHNGGRFWTGQKTIVVNVGYPGEGRVELEVDGVTYTYYSSECHDYTIYETHPVCTVRHSVRICTGHVDIALQVQRAVYTDILETNWVPQDDEILFKYDKWLKDFVWTEEKKALVIEYIEKTDWKEVYGIG